MARTAKMQLSYNQWPEEDRDRWGAANRSGADPFDDCGPAAHLAEPTRQNLKGCYARFLGYLSLKKSSLLACAPETRLNREIVADYVAFRAPSCSESGIAIELQHLRQALRYICPDVDCTWLHIIAKRIAAKAPPKQQKYHLVTSEILYALGIELMDRAVVNAAGNGNVPKSDAFDYRDGLLIALVASVPLRRRTIAALRIGKHLLKSGELWELDIPARDMKNYRPADYPISPNLSARINVYLGQFRGRIPRSNEHDGLWASDKGRPMDDGTIYDTVRRRTLVAFGFAVNLHRFRSAAGTFWSIHDPVNVRGVKDLLGHGSFDKTTAAHYIMSQSRIAGRALARVIGSCK